VITIRPPVSPRCNDRRVIKARGRQLVRICLCAAVGFSLIACGSSGPTPRNLNKVPTPLGKILLDRSGTGPIDLGPLTIPRTEKLGIAVTCAGTGSTQATVKPLDLNANATCLPNTPSSDNPVYVSSTREYQLGADGKKAYFSQVDVSAPKETRWRIWIYLPETPCNFGSTCSPTS
jgi:hypothetical protein